MNGDLYGVLGVSRDASPEEIKAAYRRLAKENHPDLGGNAVDMQRLNQAYDILSDPEKRQRYDEHGEEFASNYETAMRQLFLEILDSAARKFGPDYLKQGFDNVAANMLNQLNAEESKVKRDLEGCQKALARVGTAEDFATHTVREVLTRHTEACSQVLGGLAGRKAMVMELRERAKKMDYREEAPKIQSIYLGSSTGTTASWFNVST